MRRHGRGGEYLTENHWRTAIPFCWQQLSRCCCCCLILNDVLGCWMTKMIQLSRCCCLILNVIGCWMTKMIQLSRCCCLILNVIGCWMTKMIQLSRQTDSVSKWFGRRENSLGCSSVALNRSSEARPLGRKQVYLKTPRHVTHRIILNGWSDIAVITGLATTTPGFPSPAPPPPPGPPSPPFPPGTPLGRLRPLPQRWSSAESVMVERQIRHRIDRCTAAAAAWEPKVKVAVVVAVCRSDWPFGRCRCRGCVSHCRANSIAALHQWQPPGTLITRVSVCVTMPLHRHFALTNCVCSAVKIELLALGVGSGWLNQSESLQLIT